MKKLLTVSTDRIWLYGFPMPPQSNHLYEGTKRRYASATLMDYRRAVRDWAMVNLRELHLGTARVGKWLNSGSFLRADRFFFFSHGRVFSKTKNLVQVLDASNRIKAVDDAVCGLFGIDDKNIFSGSEEKFQLTGEMEYSAIRLSSCAARTLEDFKISDIEPEKDDGGYLVVGRRPGQSLELADGAVKIAVKSISNESVALAVKAPKAWKIRRSELSPK